MKILHTPSNPAHQSEILSSGERSLGLDSQTMFKSDLWRKFYHYPFYDIYHFHTKFLPLFFTNTYGSIVFTAHGCEARFLPHGICKVCDTAYPLERKRNIIKTAEKNAQRIFVATPDLLRSFDDAEWLPDSVDVSKFDGQFLHTDKVRIFHSTNDRNIKGTDQVERIIGRLRKDYKIDFFLAEGLPHWMAMQALSTSDIVVGQQIIGIYSVSEVEAMAMGKPVICHLNDEFEFPKDNPIVSGSLKESLIWLIENESERKKIGKKSRRYAEKYHSHLVNAKKMKKVYEELS